MDWAWVLLAVIFSSIGAAIALVAYAIGYMKGQEVR